MFSLSRDGAGVALVRPSDVVALVFARVVFRFSAPRPLERGDAFFFGLERVLSDIACIWVSKGRKRAK